MTDKRLPTAGHAVDHDNAQLIDQMARAGFVYMGVFGDESRHFVGSIEAARTLLSQPVAPAVNDDATDAAYWRKYIAHKTERNGRMSVAHLVNFLDAQADRPTAKGAAHQKDGAQDPSIQPETRADAGLGGSASAPTLPGA